MCRVLVIVALTAVVAGCGGGGGGDGARDAGAGPQGVSLGPWGYAADPHDVGLARGWARQPPKTVPVSVPGRPPDQVAIAGRAGARAFAGSVGWWHAPLTVPRAALYALEVGSANRLARAWIDGRPLCSHAGAYEPFRCRVRLRAGRHDVTLRLDWRDPLAARRAGLDRAWFNWGGLAWPVTVSPVGRVELSRPRVQTKLLPGGRARVEVTADVELLGRAARTVRVAGALRRGRSAVALRFPARRLDGGARGRVRASVTVPAPALWSPGHPSLYALELRAPGARPLRIDVGLRQLTWSASGLKLNGRPLWLRGAELPPDAAGHGDALTVRDEQRLIGELRAIGANAARAQFPLSDRFLSRLDAAGILVWQEIGPFTRAGDWHGGVRAASHRAVDTAMREQPHPSVAIWSLVNEAAGQGREGQVAYVRTTAAALRGLDPGRPVGVGIWGPHPPRAAGPMYEPLDVLGVTDYVGWYDETAAPPATQDAVALQRLRALRALFPGKLAVVNELGAGANARTPSAARGGFAYQASLLARRIGVYRREAGLGGVLVFALRDYALRPSFTGGHAARLGYRGTPGMNDKGLFDYAGRAKPAVAAVRRAFSSG